MSLQFELAPHKHVRFSDSLLVLVGYVKPLLEKPLTLDELWTRVNAVAGRERWPCKISFERVFLAVTVLFAIGAVEVSQGDSMHLYVVQHAGDVRCD